MTPEEELAFNARVAHDVAEKANSTDFIKNEIEYVSEEIRSLVKYQKAHGTIEAAIKHLGQTRGLYVSKLKVQKNRLRKERVKK